MEKEYYENTIELLKKALEFYADENNYLQKVDDDSGLRKINLDNGEQARSILKILSELKKSNETFESDYEKYMKDGQNDINPTDEVNKIINKIKKI